jgi:hypothetical protein
VIYLTSCNAIRQHSHCRSGLSKETDTTKMLQPMYQTVHQFRCRSVYFGSSLWRNTEQEKEEKKKMWMHDILVPRSNEAECCTLFQSLCKPVFTGPVGRLWSGAAERKIFVFGAGSNDTSQKLHRLFRAILTF